MSLWRSRKLLYVLLIFIWGCKSGNQELAGEIQPKVESLSTDVRELDVMDSIFYDESTIESYTSRPLCGIYNDPIFGKVKAEAYINSGYDTSLTTFGPNYYLDSIKLFVHFVSKRKTRNGGVYFRYAIPHQFSSNQKIHVFKLLERITTTSLGISESIGYNPDTLCTLTFNALGTEKRDSIDYSLIALTLKPTDFFSRESFIAAMKGLAFIPDEANTAVVGIEGYHFTLYYHNFFGLNNILVNSTANFPRRTYVSPIEYNQNLASVGYTKIIVDETKKQELLSPQNNYVFLQSNTGYFVKVAFPELNKFKDEFQGKVLINRAELIIKPDTANYKIFSLPQSIFAYELLEDGKFKYNSTNNKPQYVQNEKEATNLNGTTNPARAFLSNTFNYKIPLTAYVQSLIDGQSKDNGIALGTLGNIYSDQDYFYLSSVLDRMKIPKDSIKLKIYYTPYNK